MGQLRHRGLVAALALATATRVLVFVLAVRHPGRFITKDSLEYEALGHHWTAAYVHSHRGRLFDLSLLRPPGYPALIAAVHSIGGGVTAVIAVELVLSVATVWLTYLLAAELFDRQIATIAAFVLAIDPVSIAMSSNLTTETLFAFLLVLVAILWVRGSPLEAAVSGLLLGLATLVRPVALYLPVLLLALTALLRRRRLVLAAALAVGFAVPVGVWVARNVDQTGVATVSTIQGYNLLTYRAAEALAIDEGGSRVDAARRLEAEIPPTKNAAEHAQHESSIAWHTLLHHPRGAVVMTVEGLGRVLFGPGRAEMLRLVAGRTETRTLGDRLLVAVEALILFATLLLAAVGTVLLIRRRSWLALSATLTFAAYDVLLSAGAEADARLRMPAAPFVAVLAAVAVSSLAARSAARAASRSR